MAGMRSAQKLKPHLPALPRQVNFVPNTRSFRRPKKYAVPHCPLLQVRWWRLVIDEARSWRQKGGGQG